MKRSGRVISLMTAAMMLVSFNSAYVSAETDIIGTEAASSETGEMIFKAELSDGGIMCITMISAKRLRLFRTAERSLCRQIFH